MKNKKKQIAIFLAVIIAVTAFLFWPESDPETIEVPESEKQTESQTETTTVPTVSEKEASRADEVNQNTTFWRWEGKTYGAESTEYLTLRGDGIYILRIELADRNPEDVTGKYQIRENIDGEQELSIMRDGHRIRGIITDNRVELDGKKYKRTLEEPI